MEQKCILNYHQPRHSVAFALTSRLQPRTILFRISRWVIWKPVLLVRSALLDLLVQPVLKEFRELPLTLVQPDPLDPLDLLDLPDLPDPPESLEQPVRLDPPDLLEALEVQDLLDPPALLVLPDLPDAQDLLDLPDRQDPPDLKELPDPLAPPDLKVLQDQLVLKVHQEQRRILVRPDPWAQQDLPVPPV